MIYRIILLIVLSVSFNMPVFAQNKLKNFLNKLGNELQEGIGRGIERLDQNSSRNQQTRQTQPSTAQAEPGTCQVFSGSVRTDNDPCRREYQCGNDGRCYHFYYWPSGARTVVELNRDGTGRKINGSRLTEYPRDGDSCYRSHKTGRHFCFIPDGNEYVEEEGEETPSYSSNSTTSNQAKRFQYGSGDVAWLKAELDRMDKIEPDFAGMVLSHGYLIADEVLRQRGFGRREANQIYRRYDEKRRKGLVAIRQGFKNRHKQENFSSLKPINAIEFCENSFGTNLRKPHSRGDLAMIQICKEEAQDYARRASIEKVLELAEDIKSKPATLEGLRQNNWYALDRVTLSFVPRSMRREVQTTYNNAVNPHFQEAVSNVVEAVNAAYRNAKPFHESAERADAMCQFKNILPASYDRACDNGKRLMRPKIEKAQCDRAIAGSNASSSMLDEYIYVAGDRMKGHRLRKILCDGAKKRPELSVKMEGGGIAFWEYPRIELRDKSEKLVLALELEERDFQDNRSMTKYLFDIASGENEKREKSYWIGRRVIGTSYEGSAYRDPVIALGCVYQFIRCQ